MIADYGPTAWESSTVARDSSTGTEGTPLEEVRLTLSIKCLHLADVNEKYCKSQPRSPKKTGV
jgi:hypothetical protein